MAVIFGNGQELMSLQSWVGLPVARRQPVSPNTRMRCGLGRGSGRALPSSTAATASGGTMASQARTGNCAGLTLPKLRPGSARTLMGTGLPSNATDGQASSVIARTLALPSGPSSTHCARIFACASCGGAMPRKAAATATMARHAVISSFPQSNTPDGATRNVSPLYSTPAARNTGVAGVRLSCAACGVIVAHAWDCAADDHGILDPLSAQFVCLLRTHCKLKIKCGCIK